MKPEPEVTRFAIVSEGGVGPFRVALNVSPEGSPNLIQFEGVNLDGPTLTFSVGPGAGVDPAPVEFSDFTILERGFGVLLGQFIARELKAGLTDQIMLTAAVMNDGEPKSACEEAVECILVNEITIGDLGLNLSSPSPGTLNASTTAGQYATNQVVLGGSNFPQGTTFSFAIAPAGFSAQKPTNIAVQSTLISGSIGVNYTAPPTGDDPETPPPATVTITVTLTNRNGIYNMPDPKQFANVNVSY